MEKETENFIKALDKLSDEELDELLEKVKVFGGNNSIEVEKYLELSKKYLKAVILTLQSFLNTTTTNQRRNTMVKADVKIEGKICEFAGMTPSFIVEIPTYHMVGTNRYFYLDTDGEFYEYGSEDEWRDDIEGNWRCQKLKNSRKLLY